jgi:hypothetical protein
VCTVRASEALEACGDEICSVKASKTAGWSGEKFVLDNKPVIRESLGHATWTFLHSTAAYLPTVDSNGKLGFDVNLQFVYLIKSLRTVYPCELCRTHFDKIFIDEPKWEIRLQNIVTQTDAMLFVAAIHNHITLQNDKYGTTLFVPNPRRPFYADHSKPAPAHIFTKDAVKWWNKFFKTWINGGVAAGSRDHEYQQMEVQLINMVQERWNWNAYNNKQKMLETHEDLFDVQLETQIQRNQNKKSIPYELGCATQIAEHEKVQ